MSTSMKAGVLLPIACALCLGQVGCGAGFGASQDVTPITDSGRGRLEPIYAVPSWRHPLYPEGIQVEPRTELSAPAADLSSNRAFFGGVHSKLYAANASSGDVLWEKTVKGGIRGEILYHEGRLYFGSGQREVLAMDADTGRVAWRYSVQGVVRKRPVVSNGRLILVDGTNTVYGLELQTGQWVWQYRRDPPAHFAVFGEAAPVAESGKIYVGFSDGHIACLSATDGALEWLKNLAPNGPKFTDVDAHAVVINGTVYAASVGGGLFALDAKKGTEQWATPITGIVALGRYDDDLIAGFTDGRLMRYDVFKKKNALADTLFGSNRYTVDAPKLCIFCDCRFQLWPDLLVDGRTGRPVQHFSAGSGFFAPPSVASKGGVYALSNGGVLLRV